MLLIIPKFVFDLAELATADGTIVPGEVSFIQQLASYWEVEDELR